MPDNWWESAPEDNWWESAPEDTPQQPKPPDRPPSTLEKVQQASTGFVSGLPGIFSGLAKELPLVANRAAQVPGQIASGMTSLVADRMSPEVQAADIKRALQKYELEKKLTGGLEATPDERWGESVGRGVARAAPQVALAAMTGGATVPVQMGLGAAAQGAQSLSEGAGGGEATLSAILAGAAPGAGRLVSKAGSRLGKGAVEQYTKALNPTRIGTKVETAKIVPELLERGVTGDLESLAGRGARESSGLGKALEGQYAAAGGAGKAINATKIADDLEALKAPFMVQATSGQQVAANPGALTAIENIQNTLRELGDSVAPDQLWKFRQNVDDIVKATNGFTRELPRGKATSIAKQARAIIQKELTAAVPDVARLNSEYALWQGLEDVAKATIQRQTGQQGSRGWLARTVGGAIGATAGSAGGPVGAAGGALVGQDVTNRIAAAMSSPAWRTVSAVQKHRLAQLLTSGKPEQAINYLGRLVASGTSAPQAR